MSSDARPPGANNRARHNPFAKISDIGELSREEIHGLLKDVQTVRAELDAVYDAVPVGLCVLDTALCFIRVNEHFAAMTGKAAGEHVGKKLDEVAPDIAAWVEPVLLQVLESGLPARNVAIHLPGANGAAGRGDWLLSCRPITSPSGQVEQLVLTAEDITKRKRSEDQLLSANLALQKNVHQLRALAWHLTQAEEQRRRRIAQDLHDNLQQLLVGAKFGIEALRKRAQGGELIQAAAQVDDLLEEAAEASRTLTRELSPPIPFDAGLAPTLDWLARWMEDKHGLSVRLQIDQDARDPDHLDTRVLLFQAVRELLLNVLKHAKVTTATLTVATRDNNVQIIVADSGAGFDPSLVKAANESSGGFGLFGIREQLALLGGRMEVHSAAGQGSRFTLLAPLRRPARPSEAKDKADHAPPKKVRVVLADDHQSMRRGLARMLEEEPDIEIVGQAEDGESAVKLAREVLPDVVVMDVNMPGMDGIQATRTIRAELPSIRIVGLSMFEHADRAQAMRDAGAVAYLNKCDPSENLIAAIRG
jgi:PAS domain S-box-containing protein